MKVFHVKKQLAALFMPGFLIGIIYVNFLAKKYVAAPDLFRVGSYEVEKSKRRVISWVDRHICVGCLFRWRHRTWE